MWFVKERPLAALLYNVFALFVVVLLFQLSISWERMSSVFSSSCSSFVVSPSFWSWVLLVLVI